MSDYCIAIVIIVIIIIAICVACKNKRRRRGCKKSKGRRGKKCKPLRSYQASSPVYDHTPAPAFNYPSYQPSHYAAPPSAPSCSSGTCSGL